MAALTSKELSAIEDQLTMEQNLVAKYRMFASTSNDQAVKDQCSCIADKHQKHFDTLMSQLS